MKFAVVTHHLPHPEGTATGRHVFAVWDEARRQGHDVQAWCWGRAPAGLEAPEWVRVEPFHDPGGWRTKSRTLRRPRFGLAGVGWQPPPDAVCWAEEPESYAAIAAAARRAVTIPHSAGLDAWALRRPTLPALQSMRAERYAARHAELSVALSARVARAAGADHVVPIALPAPDVAVSPIADPTAVLIADWDWPPNQWARQQLLRAWPVVTRGVPDATLLLAGRGRPASMDVPGLEQLGPVDRTADVLARASVFAFPCPNTSGSKVKVVEAMAAGLAVVTTRAGIEGLDVPVGAVAVADIDHFAGALTDVLQDADRRCRMAAAARAAIIEHHNPALGFSQRRRLVERTWPGGGAAAAR